MGIRTGLLVALMMVTPVLGQSLLVNGSFEERDAGDAERARGWTAANEGTLGLVFASDHHEGATSAMIPGDGKDHIWRQRVEAPPTRVFNLSAMVKADAVSLAAQDDYAMLYGHILYKGRPYADATHFYARIMPGTYDWKPVFVEGGAVRNDPIEAVLISVTGKLTSGKIYVDQVELTTSQSLAPEALLGNKIADLRTQLLRVGPVDDTVGPALAHLRAAQDVLDSQIATARTHWEAAAAGLSHDVWAAMYPGAMPKGNAPEARMIYHGLAQTAAGCDGYLDVMTRTNVNGVYHSLGSWMGVVHHSKMIHVEDGWKEFDALKYSIAQARKRGIKSFAYIAALYGTGDPPRESGLYKDHPEWFARGPDKNMPTFPDPANPEVADYIVKLYTELARDYDLDGIGLDYIRYPSPTALNYDERNRSEILSRYGIDINDGEPWRDPVKWAKIREYRAEKVGAIVKRVREAVKAVKPRMTVMACLISDPEEAADYGQKWAKSSQWLDYASPMNYDKVSSDLAILEAQRKATTATKTRWIPAIGGMPDLHDRRTLTEWANQVKLQRDASADGIIIYRMGGFDPAVASFFGKGAFYGTVEFPKSLK